MNELEDRWRTGTSWSRSATPIYKNKEFFNTNSHNSDRLNQIRNRIENKLCIVAENRKRSDDMSNFPWKISSGIRRLACYARNQIVPEI